MVANAIEKLKQGSGNMKHEVHSLMPILVNSSSSHVVDNIPSGPSIQTKQFLGPKCYKLVALGP